MITPELDLGHVSPLLSIPREGEMGETSHFAHVLRELGACYWSGTVSPLRAHVASPIPERLEGFEKGGMNWLERVYAEDKIRVHENMSRAARGEMVPPLEYRVVTPSAAIVWVRHCWSKRKISRAARRKGQVHGFVQIIDDRKRLEEECIRVSEYERHQIGQELHDDVCQTLAGLSCMMELFGRSVSNVPHMAAKIHELVAQLNGGVERTRSLAHGLVPLRLIALGMHGALKELSSHVAASRGIKVGARFTRNFSTHHPDQILHLYRIAQEAMGNAVKHGQATRITLTLRARGNQMCMIVRDNGRGFPSAMPPAAGLGLHIMRYRAVSIGGECMISRRPSGGTVVEVRYPRLNSPGKTREARL